MGFPGVYQQGRNLSMSSLDITLVIGRKFSINSLLSKDNP